MPANHPFSSTYSPRLICSNEAWKDALARLDDGLGTRERILLVTGEAGTGKTALLLEATARWGERARVVCVPNPTLSRLELLEELARRLGADPPAGASKPQLLGALDAKLSQIAKASQVAVIVIEDAHLLAAGAFDELRLLVNSEAQAKRSLELVFVGLPSLHEKLAAPELAALGQRVTAHCRLEPLSNKATRRYLNHRVEATGGNPAQLFPRQSATEIHALSHGVPRAINTLASEAMRLASETGSASVTTEHVRAAAGQPPVPLRTTAERKAAPARVGTEAPVTAAPAPAPAPARAENKAEPLPTAAANTRVEPGDSEARVSAWVSRFVGSQGPPRIGSALGYGNSDGSEFDVDSPIWENRTATADEMAGAVRSHETDSLPGDPAHDSASGEPAAARKPLKLIVLDDLPEDLPASRAGRNPLPPVRHRATNGATAPVIAGGVFVAAALTTVMVLSRGHGLVPHSSAVAATTVSQRETSTAAPLQTHSSAPMVEPVRATTVAAKPQGVAASPATPPVAALDLADSPEDETTLSPAPPAPAAPHADSVAHAARRQRLGLDVGSYLDSNRAHLECDHLIVQTGLAGWVVAETDNGGTNYRVVVGVYSSPERAQVSADSMLERGLISEARVVPLPSRRARH